MSRKPPSEMSTTVVTAELLEDPVKAARSASCRARAMWAWSWAE